MTNTKKITSGKQFKRKKKKASILANPKYQDTLQLVIISKLGEQKVTAESV